MYRRRERGIPIPSVECRICESWTVFLIYLVDYFYELNDDADMSFSGEGLKLAFVRLDHLCLYLRAQQNTMNLWESVK